MDNLVIHGTGGNVRIGVPLAIMAMKAHGPAYIIAHQEQFKIRWTIVVVQTMEVEVVGQVVIQECFMIVSLASLVSCIVQAGPMHQKRQRRVLERVPLEPSHIWKVIVVSPFALTPIGEIQVPISVYINVLNQCKQTLKRVAVKKNLFRISVPILLTR
jgi:hypothetical protein